MTKSEIMIAAHAEARQIVKAKRISYREAMRFGLRRVYLDAEKALLIAVMIAQPAAPQFLWLRGL